MRKKYSRLAFAVLLLVVAISSCNQDAETGFTKKKGFALRMVEDARGQTARKGDVIRLTMTTRLTGSKDTLLYKSDRERPFTEYMLVDGSYNGDLMNGLRLLSEGDSAIFRQSADTFFVYDAAGRLPDGIPAGATLEHAVRVIEIRNPERDIVRFAEKEMPDVKARPSGLFVQETKQGTGTAAAIGDRIRVAYVAKIAGGTRFEETEGQDFMLGRNMMIQGFEQAVTGLKPGAEVRVLIPHYLAFAEQQPKPGLPAFANIDVTIKVLAVSPQGTF